MINIAIVGTGNISQLHIAGILELKDICEIVALVDIFPEKAEEKKVRYKLDNAAVFSSHEEMLKADLKIDLVHVCTPPYTHAEIAINSMNAGRNVLVEKPMATCLKECDEMLAAEKANGVTMSIIAQNRFRDTVYKLKELSDSGIAGKVRAAHVDSLWWRGHCYYDLWWRGLWEKEGGGPTLNHAVHQIDMINWIQNGLPTEVTAVLSNVMHDNSEVEDISFAILKYADGALAEVTSSVVHHGEGQSITLQCEHAKITTPFSVEAELSQPNGFPKKNTALMQEITDKYNAMPNLTHEGHTGQIENVVKALQNGVRPDITGKDGRITIELITAIYKAGFQKRTVELPIAETDDYYTFDGILKNAIYFYKKASSVTTLGDANITVGSFDTKKTKK
ncbi:MAG: Gfo/Idh/MocA family oxidoreductase [Defluviitaleaceae bacterium]|nr:Gfo/Idh/MocA family oxidoreductase [Defluviitaleaceae bacterium]